MANTKVAENSDKSHLFQKGHTKKGGRQKGTPNKSSLGVKEILIEKGIDPIMELIYIAQTTEEQAQKIAIFKELLKYCYPQLKAVEVNAEGTTGFNIVINREAVEVERD